MKHGKLSVHLREFRRPVVNKDLMLCVDNLRGRTTWNWSRDDKCLEIGWSETRDALK
jgi:hypothetical protein